MATTGVEVFGGDWKEVDHVDDFAEDGVEVGGVVVAFEDVVELGKEAKVDEGALGTEVVGVEI